MQYHKDMGAAAAYGWPSWPDEPVRVPTNPGGCPPGTWPAADRYGPLCAGVGIGDLFYTEANAQFQPGPTRLGPPDVWYPQNQGSGGPLPMRAQNPPRSFAARVGLGIERLPRRNGGRLRRRA